MAKKKSEFKKKIYLFLAIIVIIVLGIGLVLLINYSGNNDNYQNNYNDDSEDTDNLDNQADDQETYSDTIDNDDKEEKLMKFDKNKNYSLEYFRLDKDSLSNKNKNLNIAAQEVPTKIVKNILYFNNKKVNDVKIEKDIYLTDYYLITLTKTDDGEKYTFIDYLGHTIKTKSNRSLKEYSFNNLYLDNDKLYANACINGVCEDQVEIAYASDFIYIIFG